ncbi:CsbD family protein [Streptomyces sp. NBC_01260]|uniref:CsbD family protein n=1 Tax=Streptomyces laculatispora TaxID=887464 RepID=A0ABY9I3R6_9ACTN|nr:MULTISPECIES: CsbD family protein [Streptomyces]MBO0914333.1 CsbD family protein [Streptomyces laculatispora]MCX4769394.1 CsbD family protein [Streptomyces sp. NBC_01285]ROQ76453.1 CsbD-like protein [Streptomyces sp. CEV 2-1]RPK41799.1 CsbD-like protein [Streptomyces sp. ADI92-24]WLQ40261.1 CsbD family protein [Streptomyces laculatispora]
MTDGSAKDKITGKAKEAMGKMTGDRRKEAEGKTDQAKGKTKGGIGDAKERAEGVKDSLTGDDKH